MKINKIIYSNSKQAVLPLLIQDYLDICDPVLTFDRFMGEIELEKYLKNIPQHDTGRLRYDPVSMLKTVFLDLWQNCLFWVRIDYVINFHCKLIITERKTLSL